ncbi:MAG: DUF4185 domain-containing protein [Pseudomonadota bacterium]
MNLFAQTIAETSASTELVCPLVGQGAHNGTNPTSDHQPDLNLFGTDLGFSFRHGKHLMMLFGDTWHKPDAICGPELSSDDVVGWIKLSEEDNPDNCLDIHFPVDDADTVRNLKVIHGGQEQPMGALRTPHAGWSDHQNLYGIFTGDARPCGPGLDLCPADLQCVKMPVYSGNYCADPTSSVKAESELLNFQTRAAVRYIARSAGPDSQAPENFIVGHTFLTNKFLNPSARVVKHFDEGNPVNNKYESGETPGNVLIWGRPGFFKLNGGGTLDLYLLHHPLSTLDGPGDTINWQPRYFAGLADDDTPTWTFNQAAAVPVIENEEIGKVLQHSVAWVRSLQRFVMLYSGRLPRDGPFTNAGIFLRTAPHPWGPWSKPAMIWKAAKNGAYKCPGIMYGNWANGPQCPASDPYRPDLKPNEGLNNCPLPTDMLNQDLGVEYGVNILDHFTRPGKNIGEATIYWNLSTWNPYRVVLMKTHLNNQILQSP